MLDGLIRYHVRPKLPSVMPRWRSGQRDHASSIGGTIALILPPVSAPAAARQCHQLGPRLFGDASQAALHTRLPSGVFDILSPLWNYVYEVRSPFEHQKLWRPALPIAKQSKLWTVSGVDAMKRCYIATATGVVLHCRHTASVQIYKRTPPPPLSAQIYSDCTGQVDHYLLSTFE